MSYWTTKSLTNDKEYIVIKHNLNGMNQRIYGIIFRDSYAVVEKGSKAYNNLKRMPVMKNVQEQPLTFLKNLKFITRTIDIQHVYGKEVYSKYILAIQAEAEAAKLAVVQKEEEEAQRRLEEIEKAKELELKLKEAQVQAEPEIIEEIKSEMPQMTKCAFITPTGKACKMDKYEYSPSQHCKVHLLQDPRLEELEIKVPRAMTKNERRKFKKSLHSKLEKAKKAGKF